jgi:hypothetical protein
MGRLTLFSQTKPAVRRLPSGSMTVDDNAEVLATTLSSSCPPALLREISRCVLRLLRQAHTAQMPLGEITIQFASLQITAREMRGGAIIFIKPKA